MKLPLTLSGRQYVLQQRSFYEITDADSSDVCVVVQREGESADMHKARAAGLLYRITEALKARGQ